MNEKQNDDYPALKFTCQGGPLHGELFGFPKGNYVRGGTTPHVAQILKDGIRISTFRRVGAARVPVAGRYRVEFHESEGTYTAVHVASDFDRYLQSPEGGVGDPVVGEESRSATPLRVNSVAATPVGVPIYGVIPQPVSTLSGILLTHGQG